ncbi:MAG: hypothetical protein ACI867_000882 [Glaciecola sp.]
MRPFVMTIATVAAIALPASGAFAHGTMPAALIGVPDPAANIQTSANVTHLERFPEHRGTSGGRLHGDRFYLTDSTGVHVYDVADPTKPTKLGSLLTPQSSTGVALGQEDPDTNGKILLLDASNPESPSAGRLQIIDVSDPANMSVLAEVAQTAHTWTCISDCTFAYGRDGEIIDLRDPSNPIMTDVNWRDAVEVGTSQSGAGYTHDVTEIRTGRAISAGQNSTLMDTTDPANPTRLTSLLTDFHTFGYHSAEWANQGQDEIAIFGTEIAPDTNAAESTAGSDCQDEGSTIASYGTSQILQGESALDGGSRFGTREFELLDTWKVEGRGAFVEGQAPAHVLYCAHWFDLHPQWSNGGLFAAGYYEWGTRLVEVAPDGTMSEFGWFLPSDGYTSAAYWISRDVIFVADYVRGLDVIQVDLAAAPAPSPEGEVAAGAMDFEDLPAAVPAATVQDVPTTPVTGAGMTGLVVGVLGMGWGLRLRRRR